MYCKCYSGYAMSLGKGAIVCFSKKQMLNTNSSTDIELVGADDALPQVLLSMHFTKSHGYYIDQKKCFKMIWQQFTFK